MSDHHEQQIFIHHDTMGPNQHRKPSGTDGIFRISFNMEYRFDLCHDEERENSQYDIDLLLVMDSNKNDDNNGLHAYK